MRNLSRVMDPEDDPLPGQHCSGPLLIIGGGRCVWDDLEAFKDENFEGARMCINDVGQHYDRRVDHWATLHPEWMINWMEYRVNHVPAGGQKPLVHSERQHHAVDVVWNLKASGGSSGLLAVFVGILMGYDEITLAGVPLDASGHYFDPPWPRQTANANFDNPPTRSVWEWASKEVFDGKVKSLSGWTKRLLGSPIAGT